MFKYLIEFFQSSYLRSILIFFIITLIINLILINYGHFDSEPTDGSEKIKRTASSTITDGVYFTTTQFSTIGYGDITPKTNTAKIISSFCHLLIIAISLKLISEFGIMTTIDKETENISILAEVSQDIDGKPLHIINRKSIISHNDLRSKKSGWNTVKQVIPLVTIMDKADQTQGAESIN